MKVELKLTTKYLMKSYSFIRNFSFWAVFPVLVWITFNVVIAQENNCKEIVIDGEETMKICDEKIEFTIDGEQKEVTIKAVFNGAGGDSTYVKELIREGKYLAPLSRVGFNPEKTPKTYLVSYVDSGGCIDSSRIEYEGKPSDKAEICFCEYDLDRNMADIAAIFELEAENQTSASDAFYNNNQCDVYVPKVVGKPSPVVDNPVPTDSTDPGTPTSTPDSNYPEPDYSQCLISQDNNSGGGVVIDGTGYLFPIVASPKVTSWANARVTQGYGRPTGNFGYSVHTGIDLGYPSNTPIVAARDGVVEFAAGGWNWGYGNMAIIKHESSGKKTYTLYAHMTSITTKQGATIKAGQEVGKVGSTGNSTGAHLHFEIKPCPDINSIRSDCKAVDPKFLIVFNATDIPIPLGSQVTTEPKYDQACVDRVKKEWESNKPKPTPTPVTNNDLPPADIVDSLAGKKFECAFLQVSNALDRTVPAEFVYAVTRKEGSLNCTNTARGNDPCTVEHLTKTSRAYDNGFKVSGISQFYYGTFADIASKNQPQMDKCIASFGAELGKITDPNKIDPMMPASIQQKYSRYITSHAICATGIILRNYGADWKKFYKGSYQFKVAGNTMALEDWYATVGVKFNTNNNRFDDAEKVLLNTDMVNPIEYAAYRYHGGNGCSTTKTMREIYPTVAYYQTNPQAGSVTAFNAYCAKVNQFFNEARTTNLFQGCVDSSPKPVVTPVDNNSNKISAELCSASCINCKYFPISKTKAISFSYTPLVQNVPSEIEQHKLSEPAQLNSETINAIKELFNDAKAKGIELALRSGYRSYKYQSRLFYGTEDASGSGGYVGDELAKSPGISREEAIRRANAYSAIPGHSEHQLGTTADVTCKECLSRPFSDDPANKKVYEYLATNGSNFGFIVTYTAANSSITGFDPEGWHIRYIGKELAAEYMKEYNRLNGKYSLDQFFTNKCEV
jgi:murein DD-endopeptidase MepM/ murein hydrolase activator NlpD/LAS superfamily LD-carboxypeptidase LdcB